MIRIEGNCPMGCGAHLYAEEGRSFNRIICMAQGCPRISAAQEILEDAESEHTVQFSGSGFTIRHPLRERLDDKLMTCDLHLVCTGFPGPPDGRGGTFRAFEENGRWILRRLERESTAGDAT